MARMRFAGCVSAALVVLLCAPDIGRAASIQGKVVFVGPVPAQKKIEVTIDQYVCGNEKDPGDLLLSPQKEMRNAVVWIENAPAGAAAPELPAKVEIDQKGCVFIPRVVVVPAGGTVDFLNSDRLLHNIHATPKLNVSFNRTQPKSRTIPVTFAKPEIVRINCDLHSWMIGWVVVAANPVLRDHRRRRAVRLRQSPARPVQAADLARAPGHVAGERHRHRQAGRAGHRRDEGSLTHGVQGFTSIFFEASHAAEWLGSASARSDPPSSSAIVNVTVGAE